MASFLGFAALLAVLGSWSLPAGSSKHATHHHRRIPLGVAPAVPAVTTGNKEATGTLLHSPLVAAQWSFSLPESAMQNTFTLQGGTGRLKKVVLRLLAGQTVRVGALGGSVTFARDIDRGGYFGMVVEWLSKAFPKAKVIGRNGAISGSTSMAVEYLLGSLLDPGVDLVLLEYAVNNNFNRSTLFYEDVASYERLLRQLLTGTVNAYSKPKPVATLIVNMWRCCRYDGKHYHIMRFHETLGEYFNVLAQYYNCPTITVRNGLYHAYRNGDGIFKNISEIYPPNQSNSMTHPNSLGHRYVADMVIYSIYVVLAQLKYFGVTQGDEKLMAMPFPPPLVTSEERVVISAQQHEDIKGLAIKQSGWEWGVESYKAGYSTRQPGSKLLIQVSTVLPAAALKHNPLLGNATMYVHLGLLKSYEHMGVLLVSCLNGCECLPMRFDTNDANYRWSTTNIYSVAVSQHERCVLELECSDETSSGEHKLVLREVAVAATIPRPHQPHPVS